MSNGASPSPKTIQDLRILVLEGYDPTPEEMLMIVNDGRRERRAAARVAESRPTRRPKIQSVPMTKDNLLAILNEEQE